MTEIIKEREERAKEEAIEFLREQIKVEGKLVGLYEQTAPQIENKPVRHLLHTIQLDSMKHIDICQTAIEILQGEDVLKEEKTELKEGLREHVKLEEGSIERANEILKNIWIRENKAVAELIKKLRDDERRHTETLRKLAGKRFFRWDPEDMTLLFRDEEWVDKRYGRSKEFWSKEEKSEKK